MSQVIGHQDVAASKPEPLPVAPIMTKPARWTTLLGFGGWAVVTTAATAVSGGFWARVVLGLMWLAIFLAASGVAVYGHKLLLGEPLGPSETMLMETGGQLIYAGLAVGGVGLMIQIVVFGLPAL